MPCHDVQKRDFISIAVADRTRIHSQLLAQAICADPGLHVVSTDSTPKELLALVRRVPIDVALLSLELDDDRSGPELLREMRSIRAQIQGIILLDSTRPQDILECFRAGAKGIFSKNGKLEELCKCVRCVHKGQVWASSAEMSHVIEALASLPLMRTLNHNGSELLSAREREVIQYLSVGMSNREIAKVLKLSHHTVKNYLFRIFDKLGVSNRTELLYLAMNNSRSGNLSSEKGDEVRVPLDTSESRDSSAQLRLAEHYYHIVQRDGTTEDRILAYMWYVLAENAATPVLQRIQTGKENLRYTMSPQQIMEAEGRATEWLKAKKKQVTLADFGHAKVQASAD